ncbi:MAG: YfjI family protein, partial [Bacteroidota bacterium]
GGLSGGGLSGGSLAAGDGASDVPELAPPALGEDPIFPLFPFSQGVEGEKMPWRPFPTDVLPPPVRDYVRGYAAAMTCDEAMLAAPCLAVLAASVGNAARVVIKSNWTEQSVLWLAVVSPSGTMKTPSLRTATRPIDRLEMEEREAHEQESQEYQRDLEDYEALSKDEKKRAAKPQEPGARQRYRCSDITVESLARLHNDNPRGLLVVRDELAGWIGSFDKYSGGSSDVQAWISMFNGDYLQVDRKSSALPVLDIKRPNVSVVGTIQPGVLQGVLSAQHYSSGFAARLMLVQPPERPRRWTEADVSVEVQHGYEALVRRLYAMSYDSEEPRVLGMEHDARRLFADFYDALSQHISGLPSGALRSVLSKVDGLCARLALIFQLCENPDSPHVEKKAMDRALVLGEWFMYETTRLYTSGDFAQKTLSRDERLALQLPPTFTAREVRQLWECSQSAAYRRIEKLRDMGWAEDAGHGKWVSLAQTKIKGLFDE